MMALLDTLRLAFGTFVSNPLRSFLTLLGIVIGATTVVSMMGLIEGLRIQVNENLSELGANCFQVQRLPFGAGNLSLAELSRRPRFTHEDLEAIRELPSVLTAAGEDSSGGLKASTQLRESRANVSVWSGTPEYFQTNSVVVAHGRAFTQTEYLDGRRVAVIGPDLAETLWPSLDPLGQSFRLKGRNFIVVGVLKRKGGFLGGSGQDNQVMTPLTAFRPLFGVRDFRVSIQATSAEVVKRAQDEVTVLMRRRHNLKPLEPDDFFVFSNESSTEMFNNISQVISVASFGVCLLSLLVGGIGILNIMLVAVTERTREIGIRKALGAKKRRILAQFATEAVVLSLAGGLLGVALGVGLAHLARWVLGLPTEVPGWAIGLSLAMSSGVGLGFGIYPAARAAKLDPVEAMRTE
ncbi:ABC transporter permease [Myxococcus sp. MISCRS1]|jgi:putative ABC transport system permease protein|uniref:ABC transporter permease n=1 Tax=Myxococcus TaxID=32 RepID=UPI001CC147D9|nr:MULTISPECIES: ABC transporter permease [unclassified Myxococcus]MBZ4399266.1 ABC transporter permease [Myxococcus sp. AS-1-15]MBZ4411527.1 ABC transporter permease [Myxococcus sp. XM-1-1-1]MCY0999761.1 ABC transporter permease [Myxococcus sp. MISCRS1]BDT30448.1 ABC transporter permease [Myxococcus sp. MH1]